MQGPGGRTPALNSVLDPPDPPLQLIARAALAEVPTPAWELASATDPSKESPSEGAASVELKTFKERAVPEGGWGALFPRENVNAGNNSEEEASVGPLSALTAALEGANGVRETREAAVTRIEVHIPGRGAPLVLQVGRTTVAADLVAAALRAHEASGEGPLLGAGRPGDFALRLAEAGGVPDMSIPALGKWQGVAALELDAVVLCSTQGSSAAERVASSKRRSLATLRSLSRTRSFARPAAASDLASVSEGGADAAAHPSGRVVLRVRLPGGSELPRAAAAGREVAVVAPAGWTLKQARERLEELHGVSLRGLRFCAVEGTVPLEDSVAAAHSDTLGLLRLVRGVGGAMSNFDVFFSQFNELTASRYTEYSVVKVNRHGTRQARILGVDRDKVYNLPPRTARAEPREAGLGAGTGAFLGADGGDRALAAGVTKKQSRLIADIQSIDGVPSREAAARIAYRTRAGDSCASYLFEFESAEVCAELTARLRFLMSLP